MLWWLNGKIRVGVVFPFPLAGLFSPRVKNVMLAIMWRKNQSARRVEIPTSGVTLYEEKWRGLFDFSRIFWQTWFVSGVSLDRQYILTTYLLCTFVTNASNCDVNISDVTCWPNESSRSFVRGTDWTEIIAGELLKRSSFALTTYGSLTREWLFFPRINSPGFEKAKKNQFGFSLDFFTLFH